MTTGITTAGVTVEMRTPAAAAETTGPRAQAAAAGTGGRATIGVTTAGLTIEHNKRSTIEQKPQHTEIIWTILRRGASSISE